MSSPEREPHRTADDVEADVRVLMSKHHAIDDRGWQTAQQRAILHQRIDRLLDEFRMRNELQALIK